MTRRATPAVAAPQAGAGGLDVQRLRGDFPILSERVNGRPLVYLDNAATTQKPRAVLDAIRFYYEHDNANVHRGVHLLSVRATEAYERARRVMQGFLSAPAPEEIIFVRGTTEGVNLVAQSLGRSRLKPGDEVLVSEMEHHSNIVPWQIVCEQTGAQLRVAPINDDGELIVEAFEQRLSERTRIVAIGHVSNALGTINPVRELAMMARARGALVLVDGAQAAPHLRIDVQDLGCDFYTCSSHKMYGPTGAGVLWGRRELLDAMPPYQGGGEMIASVTFEKTTYAALPAKFEAGTPNIAGAVGMAAAAEYLEAVGLERIAAHEHDLLEYATGVLEGICGLRIIGRARHKAAVVSFALDGIHPHDAGTVLDQLGIAVRTGHHCAQPVMAHFGVPATCRASMGLYNTRDEIDALAAGVRKVIEVLGA